MKWKIFMLIVLFAVMLFALKLSLIQNEIVMRRRYIGFLRWHIGPTVCYDRFAELYKNGDYELLLMGE